jgi:hypothetical protein
MTYGESAYGSALYNPFIMYNEQDFYDHIAASLSASKYLFFGNSQDIFREFAEGLQDHQTEGFPEMIQAAHRRIVEDWEEFAKKNYMQAAIAASNLRSGNASTTSVYADAKTILWTGFCFTRS